MGKHYIQPANATTDPTENVVRVQTVNAAGTVVDPSGGGGGGPVDTELPAAAALSDAAANPTAPFVAAATTYFNGTTFDRARGTIANGLSVGGSIAHDGADGGNPLKTGARARTALPTAVAQDDRADSVADKFGRQLVTQAPLDQLVSGNATYTNTTAADVIAAPGASVAIVVTSILVVNGHATVDTKVEIRDGTTVKLQGFASALGGGFTKDNPNGMFVATANTAVTARNVTTGADVDVFVSGYKIPA